MRLINVHTLELEDFTAPPDSYAILSHTWGKPQDEVSYLDFQDAKRRKKKPGFAKIETTCTRARENNLGYAWVDTCCIDKSSSAELSEAINSMFEWYRLSSVCYVYLEDVDGTPTWSLYSSRWFTRGWTLQELIAPRVVEFYNSRWQCLGTKETLGGRLSEGAGIPLSILNGAPLDTVCVGQRMEWAARRKTTRKEDMAYCLMGIFNVNMPMLYGEGDKAFQRLQEEIIRQYDDHSIFAWQEDRNEPSVVRGIFAKSPTEFFGFGRMRPFRDLSEGEGSDSYVTLTNRGVRMTAKISDAGFHEGMPVVTMSLNCLFSGDTTDKDRHLPVAIRLVCRGGREYVRFHPGWLFQSSVSAKTKTIYIAKQLASDTFDPSPVDDDLQYAFFVPELHEFVTSGAMLFDAGGATPFTAPYIVKLKKGVADKYEALLALPLGHEGDVAYIFLTIERTGGSNRYRGKVALRAMVGMPSSYDSVRYLGAPALRTIDSEETFNCVLQRKHDWTLQMHVSADTLVGQDAFSLKFRVLME